MTAIKTTPLHAETTTARVRLRTLEPGLTEDQARENANANRSSRNRWRVRQGSPSGAHIRLDPQLQPEGLDSLKGWKPADVAADLAPGVYYLQAGSTDLMFTVLTERRVRSNNRTLTVTLGEPVTRWAKAPEPPAKAGTTTTTGKAGQVSEIAAKRIAEDRAHLAEHGIALPPPIYAAGTRVVEWGRDNFRASHQEWEAQTRVVEGLGGVIDAVRSEDRQDVLVDVRRDLRMRDDGALTLGSDVFHLEEGALKGVASLFADTLPGAGRLLTVLDPERRARLVNEQIERSERNAPIRLRTRATPATGDRQVFALVGPTYGAHDADRLAETFQGALQAFAGGADARGEVSYNPTTTDLRVSATWHADHVVDLAAGDVFKVGIQLRSNDAGSGSISGYMTALRNLCLNLIILGRGRAPLFRVRHVGGMAKVRTRIHRGLDQADAALAPFIDRWTKARQTSLEDVVKSGQGPLSVAIREALADLKGGDARSDVQRARTAYEAIVATKVDGVDWPVRRDTMVEMMLRGWQAEPGTTLADLVNGITRVHEEGALAASDLERVESSAGTVLHHLALA